MEALDLLTFSRIALRHPPDTHHHSASWHWSTTIPDYYNLWICLGGQGEIEVDGVRYALSGGTGFVLAPGQRVVAKPGGPGIVSNYAAHFVPLDEAGQPVKPVEFPLAGVDMGDPLFFRDIARKSASVMIYHDGLARLQAEGLVWQILAVIIRASLSPPRSPVERLLLAHMERMRNYPERDYAVDDLAREAGLSRTQYTRHFTALCGLPPNRFHIERRVNKGAGLLRDTSLSVSEVAESLGYRDVYFFSRQFKRYQGVSPLAYRGGLKAALGADALLDTGVVLGAPFARASDAHFDG